MRRLLILAAFLLLARPASATFTVSNHTAKTNCATGTSCAFTIPSTGAGHLLVAMGLQFNANTTISSITNESGWVHCTSCSATQAASGTTDAWYTLSATGGVTSITYNFAASTSAILEVIDLSFTNGPVALDQQGNRVQSTSVTSAAGVSLAALTGTNDVVVQFMTTSGSGATAISGGFTAESPFPGGDGFAWLLNTTSNTAPNWTQGSGADALGALAFKESGAATCNNRIALMGAGCK